VAEPRVSVLIVAKDEAENLAECLESVSWAYQRVVVVDQASKDGTLDIAQLGADIVSVRTFEDFASQRNAALALASGDWVFAIDADERATPEFWDELRERIADLTQPCAGYRVPIRSVILGRPFRFSGTQHDRPLRLFRRGAGRWVGAVHETVDLAGEAGLLANPLQHRTLPDMNAFLRKINDYTTLESLKLEREGRPVRTGDLAIRPVWTFLKLYIGKQGFRDGPEGLAFCALSGVSVAVRSWKHRERVRTNLRTAS
jgi:glycosyltransferase involved in cell wall biosynthesis